MRAVIVNVSGRDIESVIDQGNGITTSDDLHMLYPRVSRKCARTHIYILKCLLGILCIARDEGEDQLLAEGEELKPITKCYSRLEVSTNSSDAYRLVIFAESRILKARKNG